MCFDIKPYTQKACTYSTYTGLRAKQNITVQNRTERGGVMVEKKGEQKMVKNIN